MENRITTTKKELYFKFTRQFIICLIQPIGQKKGKIIQSMFSALTSSSSISSSKSSLATSSSVRSCPPACKKKRFLKEREALTKEKLFRHLVLLSVQCTQSWGHPAADKETVKALAGTSLRNNF